MHVYVYVCTIEAARLCGLMSQMQQSYLNRSYTNTCNTAEQLYRICFIVQIRYSCSAVPQAPHNTPVYDACHKMLLRPCWMLRTSNVRLHHLSDSPSTQNAMCLPADTARCHSSALLSSVCLRLSFDGSSSGVGKIAVVHLKVAQALQLGY